MCDDVLMRDAASATEEVQQNCARPRTTVTQKLRVTLETGPRRAHRAPAHQPHHASPTQLPSQPPGPRPPDPTACQVRPASQRPSFGWGPKPRVWHRFNEKYYEDHWPVPRESSSLCRSRFSWKSTVESRPSHLGSSARFLSCAFWICLEMAGVCLR